MQFTEGISSPPLSISRGKIFGRCVTKGGLRAARRLFVSVRNSAQVSDIRRTYPVFLEIALAYIPRLDNLSREIDENEGGWWMMPDVDLARVNYHAINILF